MPQLLVVDDEPGIRESLEYFFSSQGHQIQTASGLPDALVAAEKTMPDAIVTDLMFEGGTGLMLREELNRRYKSYNPGFIVMSGKATLESALEAVKHGVDHFLLKPLNLNELNNAVLQSLHKRTKQNQKRRIKLELAEQFYHDLSLPMNRLMPRLCMFLEGRSGNLSMEQLQSLTGQFEFLRQLLWVMKGFYPRLLEGLGQDLKRSALDANRLVTESLSQMENEFYARETTINFKVCDEPLIQANRESAQMLIDVVLTRALALSDRGSKLEFKWIREGCMLFLRIGFDPSDGNPHMKNVASLIKMVPLSLPCLDIAGLSFESETSAGPWRIGFNTETSAQGLA